MLKCKWMQLGQSTLQVCKCGVSFGEPFFVQLLKISVSHIALLMLLFFCEKNLIINQNMHTLQNESCCMMENKWVKTLHLGKVRMFVFLSSRSVCLVKFSRIFPCLICCIFFIAFSEVPRCIASLCYKLTQPLVSKSPRLSTETHLGGMVWQAPHYKNPWLVKGGLIHNWFQFQNRHIVHVIEINCDHNAYPTPALTQSFKATVFSPCTWRSSQRYLQRLSVKNLPSPNIRGRIKRWKGDSVFDNFADGLPGLQMDIHFIALYYCPWEGFIVGPRFHHRVVLFFLWRVKECLMLGLELRIGLSSEYGLHLVL